MGENSGSSDQAAISAGDTSTCGHLLQSVATDAMGQLGHMGHPSESHLPAVPTLTSNNNTAPAPGEPFILADPTFGQATLAHLSTGNNTQQITSSYTHSTNTSNTNSNSNNCNSSVNSNSNSNINTCNSSINSNTITSSNTSSNNNPNNTSQQQPQQHPPTAITSTSPPVNPLAYQFSPSSANCSINVANSNPGNIGPVTASTPGTTSTISGHHNISSASSTASSASGLNTSNSGNNSNNNSGNMHITADYLAQLLKDQKQVSAFPGVFYQVERLLSEEINRVRSTLFQSNGSEKKPLKLPDPDGPNISKQDKIFVPVDKYPEYNFVGRILGPRGMTAKQLEQETGCKIMVRGKGSMRDRKKEEQNRGKPNWEHLNEPLHVLITCEDSENRAEIKLTRAREEVEKLLVPVADGEDDLKKRQLMELAIINGTYRDSTSKPEFRCEFASSFDGTEQLKMLPTTTPILRHHVGHPLIISPQQMLTQHQVLNGTGPQLMAPPEASALIYSRAAYDFGAQYAHNILTTPHLLEFQPGAPNGTVSDISTATPGKQRRPALTTNLREHPYQRPAKAT